MRDLLEKGLSDLSIRATQQQVEQCLDYCHLLLKWNKSFNLTAIRKPNQIITHLIIDSLSVLPWLKGAKQAIDVGTGAGLPGVPLAIMLPELKWVLCDSNGKKTRFIQQACAELGIKNISVENLRVQDYYPTSPFDVIVSKAYASLSDFEASVHHLVSKNTQLLTFKSGLSADECQHIESDNYRIEETFITVPGVSEPRSIVCLKPKKTNYD